MKINQYLLDSIKPNIYDLYMSQIGKSNHIIRAHVLGKNDPEKSIPLILTVLYPI